MTTVLEAQVSESRDRLTRIETRQLQMMEHLGMDTHGRKPKWLIGGGGMGIVDLPSMGCSIKDILAAVPPDCVNTNVFIMFKGKVVTEVSFIDRAKGEDDRTLRRKA